jgi:hypothetical protein
VISTTAAALACSLWPSADYREVWRIDAPCLDEHGGAFEIEGEQLLTAGHCVAVIELETGIVNRRHDLIEGSRAEAVSLNPSGQLVAATLTDTRWGLPLVHVLRFDSAGTSTEAGVTEHAPGWPIRFVRGAGGGGVAGWFSGLGPNDERGWSKHAVLASIAEDGTPRGKGMTLWDGKSATQSPRATMSSSPRRRNEVHLSSGAGERRPPVAVIPHPQKEQLGFIVGIGADASSILLSDGPPFQLTRLAPAAAAQR